MNIDSVNDLPEKYRKQAEIKLNKLKKPMVLDKPKKRKSKYGNRKTEVNGIKFDSKKEAERFKVLLAKLEAGEIQDLRLQVGFTLAEGFKTIEGETIRQRRYVADFVYWENGKKIVEDVKSEATRKDSTYSLKKAMVAEKFGITIREV